MTKVTLVFTQCESPSAKGNAELFVQGQQSLSCPAMVGFLVFSWFFVLFCFVAI